MSQPRRPAPLTNRFIEGERLYLKLMGEGPGALFVTCSDKAQHVACPAALLMGADCIPLTPDPNRPDATMPLFRSTEFAQWASCAPGVPGLLPGDLRTVILLDDGCLAAAAIVSLACSMRASGALRLVVASPWLPPEAIEPLELIADRVVVLSRTQPRYQDISDDESLFRADQYRGSPLGAVRRERVRSGQKRNEPDVVWS